MIHWIDPVLPDTRDGVRLFAMKDSHIVGWIAFMDGAYVVDWWGQEPPPQGPFVSLEAAQLAVELMFG